VRVSITSGPVSEAERLLLEEEPRKRERQRVKRKAMTLIVSAARNPNAREVQRILNGELTPFTIMHVVELIEADAGAFKALGVGRKQLGRLTGSINNRKVYGPSARHMRERNPPPNPMQLDEAEAFIRDVANRWFERIARV